MKVCLLGIWHLGSVYAACLASTGHHVIGIDDDRTVIENLSQGSPPVAEPGLSELIASERAAGRLEFSTEYGDSRDAEILWVTFDTPVDENDLADVGFVESRIEKSARFLKPGACILISSQLPVGSTARLAGKLSALYPEKNLMFAYLPENLRLGKAIQCFTKPDRMVVGTNSEELRERVKALLSVFTENILFMSIPSAEMTKHAINAFFGLSITFANEIASICEKVGADASDVAKGLKSEERIGQKAYLNPGGPFAGGTLARDVNFLVQAAKDFGCQTPVISAIEKSNTEHRNWAARRLLDRVKKLDGEKIAVLGLTYKPGTDTLRRSSSVELCHWLFENGSVVQAYDPAIKKLPEKLACAIQLKDSPEDALRGASALVVATECPEFKKLSAKQLLDLMKVATVVDANGFLRVPLASDERIDYLSVGKP